MAEFESKEGIMENSFSTVLGREYFVIFYIEIIESDQSPFHCIDAGIDTEKPCGHLLSQFEIELTLKTKNHLLKSSIKSMIENRKFLNVGSEGVISYKNATPQDKPLFKRPFLRIKNKGVGWLLGKIEVNSFDHLKSIVKFKISNDKLLDYQPRVMLVTQGEILNI